MSDNDFLQEMFYWPCEPSTIRSLCDAHSGSLRVRRIGSGMNDHLLKPVAPGELYDTLSRRCTAQQSGHAAMAIGADMEAPKDDLIIAGFDVQTALVRTMGNRDFYLQLLTRFRDDQYDAVERIAKALEGDQQVLAERLAHTLKGVAALVGADHMSELAGALENTIHAGAYGPALSEMLDRIGADMRLLIVALERVLPERLRQDMGKS